jgi:hypothetical protein
MKTERALIPCGVTVEFWNDGQFIGTVGGWARRPGHHQARDQSQAIAG